MLLEHRLRAAQRAVLAATLVAAVVLFWLSALDSVQMIKATVVLVGFVALVAMVVGRTIGAGNVVLPLSPWTYAAVGFIAALVVATVVSPIPHVSIPGLYKRYSGLVMYSIYALLGLAVTRLYDRRNVRQVAFAVMAAGAVVVVYGVMQRTGADPFGWQRVYGDAVFSTLGNPNFAAAYLGITVPVAAWGATDPSWRAGARVAAGTLAAAALVVSVLTGSIQGWVAGLTGLGVLAIAWIGTLDPRARRVGRLAWFGGVALAAVALVVGLVLRVGPVGVVLQQGTLELRSYYWRAAVAMFRDNPVAGVGLDLYGAYYRAYRPLQATRVLGLEQTADEPHNVLLAMFANGGIILGVAYLAVVFVTAWGLVRGIRRREGSNLLLIGGLGGGWLAYQVQSLVSIDVPPLALVHWLLSGSIVVLGFEPELRTVQLPWAAPAPTKRRKPRRRRATTPEKVGVATAAVLAVVGAWAATLPFRADLAAGRGSALASAGETEAALTAMENAIELTPWQQAYWFEKGKILLQADRVADALPVFEAAAALDPRELGAVVTSARAAKALGETDRATRWYDQALVIEPQDATLKLEVARFYMESGRPEAAEELASAALALDPGNPDAKELLAALGGGDA